ISKLLPEENNIFTSIDIYNFLQEDVNKLLEVMREYNENGVLDKWNEVAINDIANLTDISCVDFNGLSWMEVDNHDDLKKAEELFK
ncbi:nucleotidyl transferase, partial [Vibrio parahaemolyticus]